MDGQVVYFGETPKAMDYFARLGLQGKEYFNPADFMSKFVSDYRDLSIYT